MALPDDLKQRALLPSNKGNKFDYPEIFVLLLIVALIALHFDFSPTSMALLIIISLPSLMILVYNYRRRPSFWTSNIVIILLSTVIGAVQFCTVLSLSLILLIGSRLVVNSAENRLKLLVVSVVTGTIFYYVSIILNGATLDCDKGFLPIITLAASIITILWQYGNVYHQYIHHDTAIKESKGRIETMVSVINRLTRFLPPQVWQPIIKSDSPVHASNRRAKVSIMFSDIAGFTDLSDSLSADNLSDILNTYMSRMTSIADKHGAVLDKFIGDGMVCFFGEPHSKGARQDALDCIAMAIDMRREMRSLRQTWRLMGFEGLYVRIGVNTGYCHVGNFGSNSRLSYTLIGKEANLASRLESIAGKGDILISQATYDYICHDYECQYAGSYQLKGFDNKIKTWQVLDPDANKGQLSKWIDHTLPGFNLHLNFKDMNNYDYQDIKNRLNLALERIDKEQSNSIDNEKAEPINNGSRRKDIEDK